MPAGPAERITSASRMAARRSSGVVPSTAPTSMPKRHFIVKAIFETRSSPSWPTSTVLAPWRAPITAAT